MDNMHLTLEGNVALIEFNSPPVNTITPKFMDELEAALIEIEQLPDIRAVIIYSGLPKVFVAGADIKAFQFMDGEGTQQVSKRGHLVLDRIENLSIPVICVIEGVAFGGGLEIALACDIRIFGEKAKVGLPETSLGIIPGYGGTQRLPLLVGEGKRCIHETRKGDFLGGIERYYLINLVLFIICKIYFWSIIRKLNFQF